MGTERRKFTKDFKRNAVDLAQSSDRAKSEIARELGIRPGLIYRWMEDSRIEQEGGPKAFVGQGNPRDEELYQLRKENADLRETNEILKKRWAFSPKGSPVMAYLFMAKNHEWHSLRKMSQVLGVCLSGYHAWRQRKPSRHRQLDLVLLERIKVLQHKHKRRYGSPRIWDDLKGEGFRISRKRVARLMHQNGLSAIGKKKWVNTTDSGHALPVAENILNREFTASAPGTKWVSDITYLHTTGGWVYLCVVIDLWDRRVIGWSLATDMAAIHTVGALGMACLNRVPRLSVDSWPCLPPVPDEGCHLDGA